MNCIVTLKDKTYELEITPYGRYDDDIQLDVNSVIDEDGEEVVDESLIDTLIDHVYDRYSDTIYEEWYDNKVGEAEAYFEGDR